MGMFSWLTADTNESIANIHSGRRVKPVYLLQPDGNPPIEEMAYEGYGDFGEVDAYSWLAKLNSDGITSDRSFGIFLECGSLYTDGDSYYVCTMHANAAQVKWALQDENATVVEFSSYADTVKDGMTVNDLVERKVLNKKRFNVPFPLKFSFNPNAKYEDLKASKTCPNQGVFY